MIPRTPIIFASLLSLAGCDGYLVTLNIRERTAAHETAHRHTLYSCNEPNTLKLVRGVAESFNLEERSVPIKDGSRNNYGWITSDRHFSLFLDNQNDGLWRVDLVDWPDFPQSRLSKQVEAEIRKGITASCSSS
jgi:hypothetical protein